MKTIFCTFLAAVFSWASVALAQEIHTVRVITFSSGNTNNLIVKKDDKIISTRIPPEAALILVPAVIEQAIGEDCVMLKEEMPYGKHGGTILYTFSCPSDNERASQKGASLPPFGLEK